MLAQIDYSFKSTNCLYLHKVHEPVTDDSIYVQNSLCVLQNNSAYLLVFNLRRQTISSSRMALKLKFIVTLFLRASLRFSISILRHVTRFRPCYVFSLSIHLPSSRAVLRRGSVALRTSQSQGLCDSAVRCTSRVSISAHLLASSYLFRALKLVRSLLL